MLQCTGQCAMSTRFAIRLAGVAVLFLHSVGRTAGQPDSGGGSSDTIYGRELSPLCFAAKHPQVPDGLTPVRAARFPQRYALLLAPSRVARDVASLEAARACWRSTL